MAQRGTSTAEMYRDYQDKDEVKAYLQSTDTNPQLVHSGARLFDILLTHATSAPSDEEITSQYRMDMMHNPHNEHGYPYKRNRQEIISDFRFRQALVLLARRNRAMGESGHTSIQRWVTG